MKTLALFDSFLGDRLTCHGQAPQKQGWIRIPLQWQGLDRMENHRQLDSPEGRFSAHPTQARRKGMAALRRLPDLGKKIQGLRPRGRIQVSQRGNSGVYFRIRDPKDPVKTGIECQVLDSYGKPDDKMGHHDHGGIIRTVGLTKNMSKSRENGTR